MRRSSTLTAVHTEVPVSRHLYERGLITYLGIGHVLALNLIGWKEGVCRLLSYQKLGHVQHFIQTS